MLTRRTATVTAIVTERPSAQEIRVLLDERECAAICYPDLSGRVDPGDEVLLNTTAVDLRLGTGGVHFVVANLTSPTAPVERTPGHIMKLRYTPAQEAVLSVEEEASPSRSAVESFTSLDGTPVICCELHSQIAPAAAAVKALAPGARVAYVMTDGAALPLGFSRLAAQMLSVGLLDASITCGQAFGGEIEAVNVYSALAAARGVAGADVVIVAQGPGNAGTGTKYGFSGIQQGEALNATGTLGGLPVAVVRMSFADPRTRHQGVSHHSLTILSEIARVRCCVALPGLCGERGETVRRQVSEALTGRDHELVTVDGELGLRELARLGVDVRTMGRRVNEDREFFLSASAAGVVAAVRADRPAR